MKLEKSLDQFEQRISNIVSDAYSAILKDINDHVEKALRNRLQNKRGLEDSLKKEARSLRKTLADSEDIGIIRDEHNARKSSFDFEEEDDLKENNPVKRWSRASKTNTSNENKEELSNISKDITSSKLSYKEITSYVRETSEESNGSRKRRNLDGNENALTGTTWPSDLEDDSDSKVNGKAMGKELKSKRRKSAAKETQSPGDSENSDKITWPPKVGSMVATLYEDGFYIGRVKNINTPDNTVDVFYMERHKGHQESESNIGDKYWVWPDAYELFSTEEWSVFGENIMIHLAENVASDEKAVFMLQGYQMWSNMAKNSRKGMIEI